MQALNHQRGGTFLGLIVGIVLGLAVALGVAIYVDRVPVPFFNKGATRTDGQDAAEAERNRDWDPNAPLRIKSPLPPASGGASAASGAQGALPILPPAEADRTAAQTPAASAATAQPVRTAQASGDPLGDFAAARVRQATSNSTAAAADAMVYFVQVGAFRTPEEAEGQRARLTLSGVQGQVSQREQAGHTVYRVRVGPFENRDAAEQVKTRLSGDGFEAVLAGQPRSAGD